MASTRSDRRRIACQVVVVVVVVLSSSLGGDGGDSTDNAAFPENDQDQTRAKQASEKEAFTSLGQ